MVAKSGMKTKSTTVTVMKTKKVVKVVKKGVDTKVVNKTAFRIRLGVMTGKNFDPVVEGTHDKDYPKSFQYLNNRSGWGGKYHIDVNAGLKIQRLHPDIFKVDLMTGKMITEKRAKKNHLNLNFWYDVGVAMMNGSKRHVAEVRKVHEDPNCRMYPEWDYYMWIVNKTRYMKQCEKAGIPMIPTIYIENGFKAKEVLKKVIAKQWDKFFVKPAYFTFFGEGALHGKTQDFLDDPSKLEKYEKDHRNMKLFLVQPYTLKPNGEVFDEVRNFFIDGEWRYSVFTHGTDDDKVYPQPKGAVKEACKALSKRVYKEVLKVAKWQGKPIVTLLNRIDIGVVPDKSTPKGFRVFLNEIEMEMTTWLARYVPFDLTDAMGEAAVKKTRELLTMLLKSKVKVPDADRVKELLHILDQRLGPLR